LDADVDAGGMASLMIAPVYVLDMFENRKMKKSFVLIGLALAF
jgi:hypothetical protein